MESLEPSSQPVPTVLSSPRVRRADRLRPFFWGAVGTATLLLALALAVSAWTLWTRAVHGEMAYECLASSACLQKQLTPAAVTPAK